MDSKTLALLIRLNACHTDTQPSRDQFNEAQYRVFQHMGNQLRTTVACGIYSDYGLAVLIMALYAWMPCQARTFNPQLITSDIRRTLMSSLLTKKMSPESYAKLLPVFCNSPVLLSKFLHIYNQSEYAMVDDVIFRQIKTILGLKGKLNKYDNFMACQEWFKNTVASAEFNKYIFDPAKQFNGDSAIRQLEYLMYTNP